MKKWKRAKTLDERGREILDPTPVSLPIGYQKPPTLQETIRQLMRAEDFRRALDRADRETFEEAEDFDVGDDADFSSPWEEQFYGQHDEERELEAKHFEGEKERTRKRPKEPKALVEERPKDAPDPAPKARTKGKPEEPKE